MISTHNNAFWKDQHGFSGLSEGAQKIALHADSNEGSIAGALKEDPSLMDSLDEFHNWSAVTVAQISGTNVSPQSEHSMKKLGGK